jgi:hypothetical protein
LIGTLQKLRAYIYPSCAFLFAKTCALLFSDFCALLFTDYMDSFVYLLTIYGKSEKDNISDKELQQLIEGLD